MSIPSNLPQSALIFRAVEDNFTNRRKLFKNLTDDNKKILDQVFRNLQGEKVEIKPEDLKSLTAALRFLKNKDLSTKSSSLVGKASKAVQNIFGRVSSKDLLDRYNNIKADDYYKLGMSYRESNKVFARNNLEKSYALKDVRANAPLAKLYMNKEKRTVKDMAEGLRILKEGAKKGDLECQLELGKHFLKAKDYKQAEHWLKSGVKRNNVEAKELMGQLANMYEKDEDYSKARSLYKATGNKEGVKRTDQQLDKIRSGIVKERL